MKLLLDEMWPPSIAEQLRRRGHDVVAVAEDKDLRGQPDEAVFERAGQEGRVIVTENVIDYRPLAEQGLRQDHSLAGIIFTSNRAFPRGHPRTAGRLVNALHELILANPDLREREHWLS